MSFEVSNFLSYTISALGAIFVGFTLIRHFDNARKNTLERYKQITADLYTAKISTSIESRYSVLPKPPVRVGVLQVLDYRRVTRKNLTPYTAVLIIPLHDGTVRVNILNVNADSLQEAAYLMARNMRGDSSVFPEDFSHLEDVEEVPEVALRLPFDTGKEKPVVVLLSKAPKPKWWSLRT